MSKADAFLKTAHEFHLGELPTEARHPLTYQLAALAKKDLPEAFRILKEIDLAAIAVVEKAEAALERLSRAIEECHEEGGRVFLYGCGATGRLSLSLESFWRTLTAGTGREDRVVGFMSGGDLALVRSIENFEDHPEFGARQVREIGFREGDLLVSCTEGGETPSVIGATEEATRLSSRRPFYLYCNPDHVLREQVERSRRVLDNPAIEKISLYTGPMALSGSTRMQASTALMLAVGAALLPERKWAAPKGLREQLAALDPTFLARFTEAESRLYDENAYVRYETDTYAMTILTDTTERAPTFSLSGFENQLDPAAPASLCYLCMPSANDAREAWKKLLLRDPVPLEWDELRAIAGERRLFGFDFSRELVAKRKSRLNGAREESFRIDREEGRMVFRLGSLCHEIEVAGMHLLHEHLLLKMLLNAHSTLVMGRMGRFESNVMTWVKPSNGKLIDRSIRYVQHLLEHRGIHRFSYEDICRQLFAEIEKLGEGESVVLKTCLALEERHESRT